MYLASNWIIFNCGSFFVHVASFFNQQPWQSSAMLALLSWGLPSQSLLKFNLKNHQALEYSLIGTKFCQFHAKLDFLNIFWIVKQTFLIFLLLLNIHRTWLVENIRMIKFWKIGIFFTAHFHLIFHDFLHKCYHISVEGKDISKILTVINSWDVKLEIRMHCLRNVNK